MAACAVLLLSEMLVSKVRQGYLSRAARGEGEAQKHSCVFFHLIVCLSHTCKSKSILFMRVERFLGRYLEWLSGEGV